MATSGCCGLPVREPGPIRKIPTHLGEPLRPPPDSPARGPPTDWGELVQVHDDRDVLQAVELALPKWTARRPLGLNAALESLGMKRAFDSSAADFSGIDGTKNLFVSDVVHEGFVDVSEEGTEAAAATDVVVGVRSMARSRWRCMPTGPLRGPWLTAARAPSSLPALWPTPRGQGRAGPGYARIAFTTFAGSAPVSFASSP